MPRRLFWRKLMIHSLLIPVMVDKASLSIHFEHTWCYQYWQRSIYPTPLLWVGCGTRSIFKQSTIFFSFFLFIYLKRNLVGFYWNSLRFLFVQKCGTLIKISSVLKRNTLKRKKDERKYSSKMNNSCILQYFGNVRHNLVTALEVFAWRLWGWRMNCQMSNSPDTLWMLLTGFASRIWSPQNPQF